MKLSVRDLLRATKGSLITGFPTTLCEHASIDTRTLKSGDVFFALQGPRFDGHHFLEIAAQKRAHAIVLNRFDQLVKQGAEASADLIQVPDTLKALQDVARYVRQEGNKTKIIGLTGSNGKTTTKEMLAQILRRVGKTLATRGNLNNHIGLPLVLSELEHDHQFAVLEMGTSKKGDMDLLVDIAKPHIGLITNVGKDHLEFLETPEGVLKENRRLLDALPPDGTAVINLDDPLLKGLVKELNCKTLTYGRDPAAYIRAEEIVAYPAPLRFGLAIGKNKYPVKLQAVGEVQVLNAMAAAAVAHALGILPRDIVAGLESFKPASMRLEVHVRPDGTELVNDAYNANPSSMRASIESFLHSYPDRPRWLVLGDMRELGNIAREEHEVLGRWIASQPVDRVFLYGRDTRFILQGLSTQGFKGTVDRYKKKRYLIDAMKQLLTAMPKPAVLFKASRSLKLDQVNNALSSLPS